MKNFSYLLLLITYFGFSQENQNSTLYHLQNRKGKIFFNLGTEIRITPFYNEKEFIATQKGYIPVNDDEQNSGIAFYYSLNYFATKNLSFGFANSFRNDVFLNKPDFTSFPIIKTSKPEKIIFIDYHFFADYYLNLSQKSQLFVRFGLSYINTNSEYILTESFYQNGVWIGNSSGERDFSFTATNYGIGFKKNKFDIMLGAYTSKSTPYTGTRYTIPYFKINYTLSKL